jgi:aminoethylphosphonate catabolism LysR family transcriptional regulator
MKFLQLRSFLAVAQHGGFTAAARVIGISQTTITSQIQSLETEYGVTLFHRHGRSVRLSETGAALLPVARQLLSLRNEAEMQLGDMGTLRRGTLQIGAVGPFHAVELMEKFHQRYPGMKLSMRLGNSEEVLASLDDYRSDVAILAGFVSDDRYFSVAYREQPVILFINRSHPLAARDEVHLRELHGQPMLLREQGSTTRKAVEAALANARIAPRFVMEIGGREALREAVIRGLGIGAVSAAEYIPADSLKALRIAGDPITTQMHVYCLKERKDSPLMKALFEIVYGQIKKEQMSISLPDLG